MLSLRGTMSGGGAQGRTNIEPESIATTSTSRAMAAM